MGDDMSFGMVLVGALLEFDVLFVLVVVMDSACVLLVRLSGNIELCMLMGNSVAVWWQ